MVDGILLVDKEQGISSYDVIRKIKSIAPKPAKIKGEKRLKIGHAGTLDPFATGLLILMFGKSTKRFDEFQNGSKEYIVKAEFGYETDTLDVTGEKIEESKDMSVLTENKVEAVLKQLEGKIQQIPPKYSAKKVDGKRAYDLARKGKEFKLEPKEVEVYKFELLNFDWPYADFKIECSSGTYVRSLIRDLGRILKCPMTSVELRRTRIGDYELEKVINSRKIEEMAWDNLINYIK